MASLGDCRAVLCRAGKPEVLTCEHSVTLESERRRVLREGGTVEAGRLSGFLQVYTYMYIYIYIYVYIYTEMYIYVYTIHSNSEQQRAALPPTIPL